jgi:cation diffusion facilitator CzcD-associated flavoprotein CzcO
MWRYENDNGASSAYRSLHIDTSRRNLGYSDFPIPDRYPDFLSHWEVAEYLDAYAERFGIRSHIRFRTAVEDVSPVDGGWSVKLSTGETRRFKSVLVANGHLWDPRWPEFPGRFDGLAIHSHHYKTAEPFDGKRVLVVGIGNSAVTSRSTSAGARRASTSRRAAARG